MANQPGSLDYLYHSGILDYCPYEAYYMPVNSQYCTYQPAYDPKYLDNAKKGYAYQYDGIDTFTYTSPVSVKNYDKTTIQDLKESYREEKNKMKCSPLVLKGLLASGFIAATFALLVKKIKHK